MSYTLKKWLLVETSSISWQCLSVLSTLSINLLTHWTSFMSVPACSAVSVHSMTLLCAIHMLLSLVLQCSTFLLMLCSFYMENGYQRMYKLTRLSLLLLWWFYCKKQRRNISNLFKKGILVLLNFGMKLGYRDKPLAPHKVYSVCVEELRQRFQGKKQSFRFGILMVWREPKKTS